MTLFPSTYRNSFHRDSTVIGIPQDSLVLDKEFPYLDKEFLIPYIESLLDSLTCS